MTEKELQQQVIQLCHYKGWGVIRLNSVSRGWVRSYYWWDSLGRQHTDGASDLIICRHGKVLFFEMKRSIKARSNARTEEAQKRFREWANTYSMKVYRIDSLEAAEEALNNNDCTADYNPPTYPPKRCT